ncbi:hypothetical protein KGY79_13145 [Candidatus Bipolaricaulota bacterium]|nr:hypothetical protein [Candidatus Bipolaricaulota bacterium]
MKNRAWLANAVPLLVLILLVFSLSVSGSETLSGSLENDLYLSPDPGSSLISSFESELTVNYSTGRIDFSSLSKFRKDSYKLQNFGADFSIGLLDLDSTISFDPSNARLDYLLANGYISVGGVNVDNTFVLEVLSKASAHGAGYKLGLSGQLPGGSRIYLDNYFGMEKNQAETLGLEEGSGYTIVTVDGTYGPSELQYTETVIEVTGLNFDCCQFHNTTKFSEAEGFEYSLFEFDIESSNLPLSLEADLRFTPQTKSIKLKPRIDLDWACFDVYTSLRTSNDENLLVGGQNSTIEGLIFEGFGITDVSLGHVSFSSLTALHGNLFRLTTESNLDLRADDYVLNPDPVYAGLYTETDYDEVMSIEKKGKDIPLTLGIDTYFDMGTDEAPLSIGLFTGSGEYEFSDQFTVGAGVAIKLDQLETIRLSFDYSF